jgi:hypothetical protein
MRAVQPEPLVHRDDSARGFSESKTTSAHAKATTPGRPGVSTVRATPLSTTVVNGRSKRYSPPEKVSVSPAFNTGSTSGQSLL